MMARRAPDERIDVIGIFALALVQGADSLLAPPPSNWVKPMIVVSGERNS